METIKAEEISQIISEQIKSYEKKLDISETGTVLRTKRHGHGTSGISRRHSGHGAQPGNG